MEASVEKDIQEVAKCSGFSADAPLVMWSALVRGKGGTAQFNHAEFGGFGQRMRGGMTMIGDMFNHSLKARIDDLCNDLSQLSATRRASGPSSPAAASTAA